MYFLDGSKGNSNIKKSEKFSAMTSMHGTGINSDKTYDSLTIGASHHKVISVNSGQQDFQYVENYISIYWARYIYIYADIYF